MSELETSVEGIGHLLSDRLLMVPDYQRAYSWEEDHISQLWEDLEHAFQDGADEYFLGPIVLTQANRDEPQKIIDGQQRLASVAMLIAAIRDLFQLRNDAWATNIESDYLGRPVYRTQRPEQKLRLDEVDNDLFRELTLVESAHRDISQGDQPVRKSHELLLATHRFFEGKITELVDGLGVNAWQQPLLDRVEYFDKNVSVICIEVADEDRAFEIFETLNGRGLDLSTGDLLKKHFYERAGNRLPEVKDRWNRAMNALSPPGDQDVVNSFLRQYWASATGVARIKALYSTIKPTVRTAEDAVRLAKELANAAPLWDGMFDRDAEIWSDYPVAVIAGLDSLRYLQVEQCRPLLLAALRRLPKTEIQELLGLIVGWSVRWSVAGGGSAGTVERLYAQTAKRVTERKLKSAAEIASHFETVPDDGTFRKAFAIAQVRRTALARYYLRVLERASVNESEPELVPNEDVEEVNLEHVLPKKAGDAWGAFSPDEKLSYVFRLGNQALLKKTENRRIGNKPFSTKQAAFATSSFSMTNEIAHEPTWTPAEIDARQLRMADLAVKIWRRT